MQILNHDYTHFIQMEVVDIFQLKLSLLFPNWNYVIVIFSTWMHSIFIANVLYALELTME